MTNASGTERLAFHMNIGNLDRLPDWSQAPKGSRGELMQALKAAGFVGLQGYLPDEDALAAGLVMSGMGRVLEPRHAEKIAAKHKAWGYVATTLHVGDGFESDAEMDRLADAVLEAADAHAYPLYVETHRATMTQDMRRTLDLVERRPGLRFNADLSHWYTGHEMLYGDFGAKLDRLSPVFERVRYLHGRIGNTCAMQAPLQGDDGEPDYVGHFREMWRRCFEGFLRTASSSERVIFAPELLADWMAVGDRRHPLNYARLLPGGEEETDRWTEALRLLEIAREAFAAAGPPIDEVYSRPAG